MSVIGCSFGFQGGGGSGSGTITGAGTPPKMPVFTSPSTIGDSQVSDDGTTVFIGASATSTSAMFEVKSTTQGALFPRMTTTERDLIPVGATEDSLFIFNTSIDKFQFWDDTAGIWQTIESSAIGGETWSQVLTNGATSSGVSPELSDGDVLIAENGGGQLNLRDGGDGIFNLSSDNGGFTQSFFYGDTTKAEFGFGTNKATYSSTGALVVGASGGMSFNETGTATIGITNLGSGNLNLTTVSGNINLSSGTGNWDLAGAGTGMATSSLALTIGSSGSNVIIQDNTRSVGMGTSSPNASAKLDMVSTTQGFLAPRMTNAQRNAIGSPAEGLWVYQTDTLEGFYYYDGTFWVHAIGVGAGGIYSGSGIVPTTVSATISDNLTFGTDLLFLDEDNTQVGINTSSPSRLFDVNGDMRVRGLTTASIVQTDSSGNIDEGTWDFSGNDIRPITDGSNIGDATHGVGTLFMASTIDYRTDLDFINSSSTYMTLTTGGRLGIGTTAPNGNLEVAGSSNPTARIIISRYGASSNAAGFQGRKARGTEAAPTQVLSGDTILQINASGYTSGGSFNQQSAGIEFEAAENFTASNGGTDIYFWTTNIASSSPTQKMTLAANGNLGIGTSLSPNASALIDMGSTTQGLLTPRMTSAQRVAIASPATGLLVYQTDGTAGFYYFNGSVWVFNGIGTDGIYGGSGTVPSSTVATLTDEITFDSGNVNIVTADSLLATRGFYMLNSDGDSQLEVRNNGLMLFGVAHDPADTYTTGSGDKAVVLTGSSNGAFVVSNAPVDGTNNNTASNSNLNFTTRNSTGSIATVQTMFVRNRNVTAGSEYGVMVIGSAIQTENSSGTDGRTIISSRNRHTSGAAASVLHVENRDLSIGTTMRVDSFAQSTQIQFGTRSSSTGTGTTDWNWQLLDNHQFTHNVAQLTTGDFIIRGLTDTDLFRADASVDRVGFGVATPSAKVHVVGNGSTIATTNFFIENSGGTDIVRSFDSGEIIAGTGTDGFFRAAPTPIGSGLSNVKITAVGNPTTTLFVDDRLTTGGVVNGLRVFMNGANGTNRGVFITATGATTNTALEISSGRINQSDLAVKNIFGYNVPAHLNGTVSVGQTNSSSEDSAFNAHNQSRTGTSYGFRYTSTTNAGGVAGVTYGHHAQVSTVDGQNIGMFSIVRHGTNAVDHYAIRGEAQVQNNQDHTGDLNAGYFLANGSSNSGTGGTLRGAYIQSTLGISGANADNLYGAEIVLSNANGATVDNDMIGLQVSVTNSGTVTGNMYGAIIEGANSGFFTASPTAYVHLGAGTATASTSPLKFTTGTLNTVAETGAMEFASDFFYLTANAVRAAISTFGRSVASAATYTALVTDRIIGVTRTTTGACQVDLPSAALFPAGYQITIMDEGLNASTNNITIDASAAQTINGNLTEIINVDADSRTIYSNGVDAWFIM